MHYAWKVGVRYLRPRRRHFLISVLTGIATTGVVFAVAAPQITLSVMNGFDLFEQVKRNPKWRDVPYVFMSSLDDYDARHTAKVLGADDYVTKPFHMEEVLARLRAVVRRSAGQATSLLEHGDLVLDERQSRVSLRGVAVPLTRLEYLLLAYLMRNRGRVVPQAELIEHIYSDDGERDLNAIEALVVRLRKKVGVGKPVEINHKNLY